MAPRTPAMATGRRAPLSDERSEALPGLPEAGSVRRRRDGLPSGARILQPGEFCLVTIPVNIPPSPPPIYMNCDLQWRLLVNECCTDVNQDEVACI